jgi:hypothetical protein
MTALRQAEAAYHDARYWARVTSTIRLRFAERRLRGRVARLTQPERAYLSGLRDELRDRGVEVPRL